MSEAEYDRIIYEWNQTDAPCPAGQTIISRFEEQVAQSPDDTAVIFKDSSLTYGQLNQRANQLAHTIIRDYKALTGKKITGDT